MHECMTTLDIFLKITELSDTSILNVVRDCSLIRDDVYYSLRAKYLFADTKMNSNVAILIWHLC